MGFGIFAQSLVSKKISLRAPNFSAEVLNPGQSEVFPLSDSHGNTIRELAELIELGVVRVEASVYEKLYDAYYDFPIFVWGEDEKNQQNIKCANTCLKQFSEQIKKIHINPDAMIKKIIFMGDRAFERGRCDIFTFLLLQQLFLQGLNYSILLGNHDVGLLCAYLFYTLQKNESVFDHYRVVMPEQAHSFVSMDYLFKNNPQYFSELFAQDFLSVIQAYFLKKLKIFDCAFLNKNAKENQSKMILLAHTPVGLETIKCIASYFGLEFSDENFEQLAKTMQRINELFLENIICPEKLAIFLFKNFSKQIKAKLESTESPFFRAVWNRTEHAANIQLQTSQSCLEVGLLCGHLGQINYGYVKVAKELLSVAIAIVESHDKNLFVEPLHLKALLQKMRVEFVEDNCFSEETYQEFIALENSDEASDSFEAAIKSLLPHGLLEKNPGYLAIQEKREISLLKKLENVQGDLSPERISLLKEKYQVKIEKLKQMYHAEDCAWWQWAALCRARPIFCLDTNLGKVDDFKSGRIFVCYDLVPVNLKAKNHFSFYSAIDSSNVLNTLGSYYSKMKM